MQGSRTTYPRSLEGQGEGKARANLWRRSYKKAGKKGVRRETVLFRIAVA